MPTKSVVNHLTLVYDRADPAKGVNFSPVAGKTGGKSARTKNIRSATPRGFAKALFLEHAPFTWGHDGRENYRDYGNDVVVRGYI